jgi:hypothetical protein
VDILVILDIDNRIVRKTIAPGGRAGKRTATKPVRAAKTPVVATKAVEAVPGIPAPVIPGVPGAP